MLKEFFSSLLILNPYEKMWWREGGGNGCGKKTKDWKPSPYKTLITNLYWKLLMKNFIKRSYNINNTNIGEGVEKPSWPPNEGIRQSTQSSSPNIKNEEKPFVVEALNLRTLKPTINIAFGFFECMTR